jgi:hypothetical protein
MAKGDYTLDWTGFDVDEEDFIDASHIDTIQTNVDKIKDSLANVTHDSSFLDGNKTDYDSYKKDSILAEYKSGVEATHFTFHDGTHHSLHRNTHLTNHMSSIYAGVLGSRYIDYYISRDNSANINDYIGRNSDHDKTALSAHKDKERESHDSKVFKTHYSNNENPHYSAESNRTFHSIVS